MNITVVSADNEYLCTMRIVFEKKKLWDLPGGHIRPMRISYVHNGYFTYRNSVGQAHSSVSSMTLCAGLKSLE
jgi:hypothetical protein